MYNCEICNRELFKKIRYGGYTLCSKHMHQLQKYGKFLDNNPRSQKDLNDYIIKDDIAIFNVYDQQNNKNGEFIIDIDDIDKIKYIRWRKSHGYIVTGNNTKTRPTRQVSHIIMGLDKTDINHRVDHINGNPLDNRKSNLRICSQSKNTLNKARVSNNTSGFIGIYKDKRKNRKKNWVADIRINNKRFHIGNYIRIEEAVYARYIAEVSLYGEYRNTNDDKIKLELFKTIPYKRKEEIKNYVVNKLVSNT